MHLSGLDRKNLRPARLTGGAWRETQRDSRKIVFLIRCVNFRDKSTQRLKGLICRISIAYLIGNIYHADTNVQQS
jgi:hypothetical protein